MPYSILELYGTIEYVYQVSLTSDIWKLVKTIF